MWSWINASLIHKSRETETGDVKDSKVRSRYLISFIDHKENVDYRSGPKGFSDSGIGKKGESISQNL
jgi:hypothetical protein